MGHTLTQWQDRVRGRLGDFGVAQKIPVERIPLAIDSALAIISRDAPRIVSQTLTADGSTYELALTSWIDRWSRLESIEYPSGERIPQYLDPVRDAIVVDDSTTFRLLDITPATGNDVVVRYTATWPYPDDTATTDKIPAPWFEGVTALAAAEACAAAASAAAAKQRSSVAGDFFDVESEPLWAASKSLRGIYEKIVLGSPMNGSSDSSSTVAYAVQDVNVFPNAIFHRRRG